MRIETTSNTLSNTKQAVTTAYEDLLQKLGATPSWIAIHSTIGHDSTLLISTLEQLAKEIPIHGGTSCVGVMTGDGFHNVNGKGLALLGISDPKGAYGVSGMEINNNPRETGAKVARQALDAANLKGVTPKLAWLTCAPGYEEEILAGIEDVLGSGVPIVGGSAADDTIEGNWSEFHNGKVFHNGVVLTVMSPSVSVGVGFSSGYFAMPITGVVTSATKRTIHTIDNKPAAEVYNEWTGGAIRDELKGGKVLSKTSLSPLGRVVKTIGAIKLYQLSHPETVTNKGDMTLFTDIKNGDELVLMKGTKSGLVNRVSSVITTAIQSMGSTVPQVEGALIIFCAGCMLTLQDEMNVVAKNFSSALNNTPFLSTFTFGEQGCFKGGLNRHGNLMISAIVFGKTKE